jgi:hypothetical protein
MKLFRGDRLYHCEERRWTAIAFLVQQCLHRQADF